MSQDIMSFGLDIKSFDAKKKKQLQEFIELFDKLSKYDGMKITPVRGDGLVAFNKSLKETGLLLDDITKKMSSVTAATNTYTGSSVRATGSNNTHKKSVNEVKTAYELLEDKLKKQALAYQNIVLAQGRNSVSAKQLAKELSETVTQIKLADKALDKASGGGVDAFARSLTHGLSLLRTIAYILPGLGIAGIFNFIFDRIGDAADALGLFEDKAGKLLDTQIEVNKAYKEFTDILKNVAEAYKTTLGEQQSADNQLKFVEAQGKSAATRLEVEKEILRIKAQEANQRFIKEGGFERERELNKELIGATGKYRELRKARDEFYSGNSMKRAQVSEKEIEAAKSTVDRFTEDYTKVKKINEDNTNLVTAYRAKLLQIEEYHAEQKRKLILKEAELRQKSVIDTNEIILKDDRSTEAERIKSINNIREAELEIAEANLRYVKSRPDFKNFKSLTKEDGTSFLVEDGITAEGKVAIASAEATVVEARKRALEKIEKVQIEYYQRFIKAKETISKTEIESEALIQKAISDDVTQELNKRLVAYGNYIYLKQQIQDIELEKDVQRGSKSRFGRTSLTLEEDTALRKGAEGQKSNIQADAEKSIYNIVSTSLDRELKKIKDINDLEYDENKKEYLRELIALNDFFDEKIISLKDYQEKRKIIDEQYRVKGLDIDIAQDEANIFRLENQRRKLSSSLISADAAVKKATEGDDGSLGSKNKLNKAVGEQKAINDAIFKLDTELDNEKKKLLEDEIKREQRRLAENEAREQEALRRRKENIQAYQIVESAILDAIKTYGDAIYQERLRQLELHKQVIDEGLNAEINAIEKSTLSQKNKIALEIQLQAQKEQSDKNYALESRKIKREQAEFDKKISMAKIISDTAVAVVSSITVPVLAAAYAAAGAIQLALVANTPIPYKHGTPPGGHKGGLARYGEDGAEWVKKPYQSPYLVTSETVSYLPKGTEVIPVSKSPIFGQDSVDDGWDKIMYLSGQMKRSNREIKNIFKPNIYVDTNFMRYKSSILGRN